MISAGNLMIDPVVHFKRCCKMAKKFSKSSLPLMRVQHLAAVYYGFRSFSDLKANSKDLIYRMGLSARNDVITIMEVIANA